MLLKINLYFLTIRKIILKIKKNIIIKNFFIKDF
jgi:hypothetical protein